MKKIFRLLIYIVIAAGFLMLGLYIRPKNLGDEFDKNKEFLILYSHLSYPKRTTSEARLNPGDPLHSKLIDLFSNYNYHNILFNNDPEYISGDSSSILITHGGGTDGAVNLIITPDRNASLDSKTVSIGYITNKKNNELFEQLMALLEFYE